MYGLIGKVTTTPGKRDVLAAILLSGTGRLPGCLSYVVAADPADPDALWITEVWEDAESHRASLALPAVQQAREAVHRVQVAEEQVETIVRHRGSPLLSVA